MSLKSDKKKNKKPNKKQLKAELKHLELEIKNLPNKKEKIKKDILIRSNKLIYKEKYSLRQKLNKYNLMLEFTDEVCPVIDFNNIESDFKDKYLELRKYQRIANNGVKGEDDIYNSLKILNDIIVIIKHLNTPLEDKSVEHDLVVISESGIFTIEVKYISAEKITISRQGLLNNTNIIEQSRRHIHSLRRTLSDTKYSDIPIYPIIVFSNDRCKFKNENENIPICYKIDIENIIFDKTKYPICIDKNEFKNIKDTITEKCKNIEEKKYPLDIDEKSYYEALAEYASNDIIEKEKSQIKERIEKIEDELPDTVGTIFTALLTAIYIIVGIVDN